MLPAASHSLCFLSFNPSLFRSFTQSVIVTCYQWLPTHLASSPLTLHSSGHSLIQTLSHATSGWPITLIPLLKRESDTRFLTSDFFHKSVSPGPLRRGRFQIFSKIRGDIRVRMFISGVNDTGEKREKFWNIIFFHILLRA
jgi:hypothetical protein